MFLYGTIDLSDQSQSENTTWVGLDQFGFWSGRALIFVSATNSACLWYVDDMPVYVLQLSVSLSCHLGSPGVQVISLMCPREKLFPHLIMTEYSIVWA